MTIQEIDELKAKYLDDLAALGELNAKREDIINLIASLSSDETKHTLAIKYLGDTAPFDHTKFFLPAEIVCSYVDDKYKLEQMTFQSFKDSDKVKIICSLSSDEEKKKFLNDEKPIHMGLVALGSEYLSILKSLRSDEDKLSLLEKLKDRFRYGESQITEVIETLSSDEKKLELLKKVDNERERAKVIASLSSDEKKLELLKEISNMYDRARIIVSLSSDEEKEKQLGTIYDHIDNSADSLDFVNDCKAQIISSFSSDELKTKYLDKLDDSNKLEVILSLSSNELKTRYIDATDDFDERLKIVISMKPEERQQEMAQKQKVNETIHVGAEEPSVVADINELPTEKLEELSANLSEDIQAAEKEVKRQELLLRVLSKREKLAQLEAELEDLKAKLTKLKEGKVNKEGQEVNE